jgi:hypothetical protein
MFQCLNKNNRFKVQDCKCSLSIVTMQKALISNYQIAIYVHFTVAARLITTEILFLFCEKIINLFCKI